MIISSTSLSLDRRVRCASNPALGSSRGRGTLTCSGRSADVWATGRVPWPATVKSCRPIPSINPTRSVRRISGAWTPESIQVSVSFEWTCGGWRDYRVGLGEQYCERYGKVAETVPQLMVARVYGESYRMGAKEVSRPIRECEWDMGGGFTECGPGDSQMHSPRSCFLSVSYGPISGHRVAARGKWRWTGAPPLFAARCGRGGVAQFTFAQHPLGGSLPSH